MGEQLYIQVGNPHHAYVIWLKNTIIAKCDDREDYKNTVNELSEQGYTFVNRV